MKSAPLLAGLAGAFILAAAAPSAKAANPGCDIRVMREGSLRFEAFQWDRRGMLGGQGESAEVRIIAQSGGVISIGRPELVAHPAGARAYALEYRFSIDTRRSGRVDSRLRSLAGRWSATPLMLQAPPGGLAIELYARLTPLTGDGLPSGRYHAVVPVDCVQ